jgi:hypothetical protein
MGWAIYSLFWAKMGNLKKLEESSLGFEPILPSVCAFGPLD